MNHEPPKFIYVPQDDRSSADGSAQVLIWGVAAIGVLYIVATLEEWYHDTVVWLTQTRDYIYATVEGWYNASVAWLTATGNDISATVESWYHASMTWLAETGAYIASFWPF